MKTMGLSLCHTLRGRILVMTLLVGTTCFLMLVYLTRPMNMTLFPTYVDRDDVKKVSQVRQDMRRLAPEIQTTGRKYASDSKDNTVAKRFPNAIIIGARKGGTRALINMLKSHPSIVAAVSEVHYFDREVNFARGVQWYIDQMPYSRENQLTIEKSPSYFVSPATPHRIYTLSPNLKLILIIRDPIDRTVSDYTQLDSKKNKGHRTFEGEVFLSPSGEVNTGFGPIHVSMYDVHFEKWLKYFTLDQILIVDGDMLIKDPIVELKKVEEFLEVERYFTKDLFYFNSTKGFHCWKKYSKSGHSVPQCLGSGKGRQHPKLSDDTMQRLLEFFEPHNKKFFKLIQRQFNWTAHKR